jgi:organic hydroperoxide reductase OsmC/OhrA
MIVYPISFFGSGVATPGIQNHWGVKASNFDLTCSVPKEFEGSGEAPSPEDFYLLSLQNCFIATFKVYAAYSKLNYDRLTVISELIVDKDDSQRPVMKAVKLKIEISNSSNQKKAELLVQKTLENGFILQSVKTQLITEISYVA